MGTPVLREISIGLVLGVIGAFGWKQYADGVKKKYADFRANNPSS